MIWGCACGNTYAEDDPDLITRHVSTCDYVDGTGQEIEVTVKFSVVQWYIATVKSSELAQATGGLPFEDLRGAVAGFGDDDTESSITEMLSGLIEHTPLDPGGLVADGFDIGDVYDARRDRPSVAP